MSSPFSDRKMIKDQSRFFGRTLQRTAILNALASKQSVSIIGERRIGRSSLLWHIKASYRQGLPRAHLYQFAYLDVARDTIRTPAGFYAEAAQALFGGRYDKLEPGQFDDLLLEQNPTRSTRYVLLLDEFNVLQRRRDQFDDDFFDGLRSRANDGSITYVLATHTPLEQIAIANGYTSTFFGIFTPVTLGGLTHDEARQSILRPATPALTDTHFVNVVAWTGRDYHPLKLNIAADLIWQRLPTPNYDKLRKKYREQIAHAFGHGTRRGRRRKWLTEQLRSLPQAIDWVTGGKPYLFLLILTIVGLLIFGVINWDQLFGGILDAGGIPTLTPTP